MAATPSNNRLKLTPSNSPFIPRPARTPLRGRTMQESRLSLKRVVGTTCRSPTGFDTVNSLFAYIAGGAVVAVDVEGQHYSQRFFRARPTAVPVYSVTTTQKAPSTPTATTPKANDSRNRVAPNFRESQYSPADWADSPGSKTWTSRERIKAATCLALSRDGKYLAVGETGYAPRVLIFSLQDASSDTPLVSISEHTFGVNAVAWSPDSKYLASLGAASDGFLYVWKIDPRTGAAKLFQQNRCTSYIRDMVWMGNSLITLGLRHVKVWKIEEGPTLSPMKQRMLNESTPTTPTAQKPLPGRNMLLGDLLEATFTCAAVDGKRLIICTETGDVCILDDDDRQMKLVKVLNLDFAITTITIRGNVAYVGGKYGHFATLDVEGVMDGCAQSILTTTEASGGIVALGFLTDKLVTIDSRQSIDVWNPDFVPGQQVEAIAHIPIPGHGEPIAGIHALRRPNKAGAAFVTWSYSGNVTFWDMEGQIKSSIEVPIDAAEPDGESELVNQLTCARTTRNGKLLVTADRQGILKVTDVETKDCLLDTKAHSSDCICVSIFEKDSKFVMACCGRDRTAQLFHRNSSGNIEHFQTLEFAARVVQVLVPTEDKVVTCSLDRTLQVHDLVSKEGEPDVLAAIPSKVMSLKASPTSMAMGQDNRTIFVSLLDRSVCQFDLTTGRQVCHFKCMDEGGVESAVLESLSVGQWVPKDLDFLLGSSNTDKSVRIYDANSGTFLDREWGHTEAINGVCLVDDDDGTRKIVSVGSDGTIMIWTLDLNDPSPRSMSREPSPVKEAVLGRPTLRRVLSKAELAEFQRPLAKKLSSAEPITADALTELDHELRLTAAALGDRAIRSKAMNETVLSGLLDQYSERLVTLLDEKLRLTNQPKERDDGNSSEERRRSSADTSKPTLAPLHLLATREGALGRGRGGPWGMNQPAAYTPLESLFLFQSLLTQGVDTGAFVRVSELLKNNVLIKGGATYDPARLTPDALQQLFLLLLREEIKGDEARPDGTDASASPGSRKRKLGSPPLPSLKDAYEHIERVPALVDRLYSRYREHVVKQIREEEHKFANVQRDIQILEKAEKERLAKAASQSGTPALAPRDAKTVAGAHAPSSSPAPTPGAATGIKRGPTPNTPVYPPKPPTSTVTHPAVAPPSHLPAGTPPVRPSPSPKPPNAPGSVLQPPAGLPQAASRVLQPPVQRPKPAISPRPDAANKPKDAAGPPQAATTPAGALKWEKPYQPPLAGQTPASGQFFQQNITPNAAGPPKGQQPQQWQQQQGQYPVQTPSAASQPRPPPGKSVLVPPQTTGQLAAPLQPGPPRPTGTATPQVRPPSTTPVLPPGRPIQPQQPQQIQQQAPRPIASASPAPQKGATGPIAAPQRWSQAQAAAQHVQRPSSSASPAPLASQKDKPYTSPYTTQPPRPAIPEHIIRQAAGTPTARRLSPVAAPQTPRSSAPAAMTRGFGTKWATHSTPSTPGPIVAEPESPAYEPVSPPQRAASIASDTAKTGTKKPIPRAPTQGELTASRTRGRPARNAGASATPSVSGARRSQSVASQADELSMDYSTLSTKIKKEVLTPRLHDDAGDTTADESVHGRPHMATPCSVSSRLAKRKRQETPPEPPATPSHVLWTRGFTKVSSSALDQISSHRDANMFATGVREKDAPNYRQIVLQPQDITSIRSAIKQGNKAAIQAASSLPGGDPGTASVWVPLSEDLIPPKGIINSAQLERELVHMFCNAIMYNPDPDRGLGATFMRRSQDEEEEIVGYHVDENGVVKNTRSMFVEVEKLLGDLRSAEKERGMPPLSATRQASVATPADDTAEDEDELAGDGGTAAGIVKRRRISTRG
ncbi:Mitogen-activated protein kinase-binding protein 1 [Tolypocladium paradoxum]|uniref:Mitogen-activated protein kinase-binding protein 1 n=1 Tax=Tolypocladium paradoxum TaxID=94208 RepID=A0A2S4L5R0_9HYPO|nr:Mitogen-activated protein kinase-binding protein 1 [Tolypocladium paradoxum]